MTRARLQPTTLVKPRFATGFACNICVTTKQTKNDELGGQHSVVRTNDNMAEMEELCAQPAGGSYATVASGALLFGVSGEQEAEA